MIHLIIGENTYAAEQEVRRISRDTGLAVKRIDGDTVDTATLADYMVGLSLFGAVDLPVISGLSANTAAWQACADLCERAAPDNHLVLVEPRVDKRTKAYKTIARCATVVMCEQWTDRERAKATQWLQGHANAANIQLTNGQIRSMIDRALVPSDRPGGFVIDQMRLHTALRTLAVLPEITDEAIATVMPPDSAENVFELLEYAVHRDELVVARMMQNLRSSEEPQKVFALVAGQLAQMAMLLLAGDVPDTFGIHPYVAQKMRQLCRQFTRDEMRHIIEVAAQLDSAMKLSEIEPWNAVDRLLLSVSLRA